MRLFMIVLMMFGIPLTLCANDSILIVEINGSTSFKGDSILIRVFTLKEEDILDSFKIANSENSIFEIERFLSPSVLRVTFREKDFFILLENQEGKVKITLDPNAQEYCISTVIFNSCDSFLLNSFGNNKCKYFHSVIYEVCSDSAVDFTQLGVRKNLKYDYYQYLRKNKMRLNIEDKVKTNRPNKSY